MYVRDDQKYVWGRRLYACVNTSTQKFKGLDSKEIISLPVIKKVIYMASHFNYHRKKITWSSQDPLNSVKV